MKSYLFLILAIAFEIVGTTFLKKSEQFTLWKPTLVMAVSYIIAFYFLSITLKSMPVGIAYALWSGIGIVCITFMGVFLFKQSLDLGAIIGLILITLGVIVIHVFSKMNTQ